MGKLRLGILGLMRETSSYYQGDGYAEDSQWNMVDAVLSLVPSELFN